MPATQRKLEAAAPSASAKPATKMRRLTHAEWQAEGEARFGKNKLDWRFECPSCAHVAKVSDWRDAGAKEGEVAFSCIGRRLGADDAKTFKREGGPCNYAGGGLFRLNPVAVDHGDGTEVSVFEFAPDVS